MGLRCFFLTWLLKERCAWGGFGGENGRKRLDVVRGGLPRLHAMWLQQEGRKEGREGGRIGRHVGRRARRGERELESPPGCEHPARPRASALLLGLFQMKTGPFAEHSNQLWNISAVPSWSKVNQGLIRMYKAEVSAVGKGGPGSASPPRLCCLVPLCVGVPLHPAAALCQMWLGDLGQGRRRLLPAWCLPQKPLPSCPSLQAWLRHFSSFPTVRDARPPKRGLAS